MSGNRVNAKSPLGFGISYDVKKSCKHSGRQSDSCRRSGRSAGGGRILYAAVAHRLRASVLPVVARKVGGSNPSRRNKLKIHHRVQLTGRRNMFLSNVQCPCSADRTLLDSEQRRYKINSILYKYKRFQMLVLHICDSKCFIAE